MHKENEFSLNFLFVPQNFRIKINFNQKKQVHMNLLPF